MTSRVGETMRDAMNERAERWFEAHSEDFPSDVVKALAKLLRDVCKEEREAAACICDEVAHIRAGYALNTVPSHRLVESFAADTASLLARRIRARGGR